MANTITIEQRDTSKTVDISWEADSNTYASVEIHRNNIYGEVIKGFSYTGGSTGSNEVYTFQDYGTYTFALYTVVNGTGDYRAQDTLTLDTPQLYTCYLFYDCFRSPYYADGSIEDLSEGSSFYVDTAFHTGGLTLSDEVISEVQTNISGQSETISITSSLTVRQNDFSIAYIMDDLDFSEPESTEDTIKLKINNTLPSSYSCSWKTGGTTKSGTNPTFSNLSPGTSYTFTLTITDSRDVIVGSGTITASTESPITTITYIYATKDGEKKWWPATPYIYANGKWNPATAHIYSNSKWNP